MSIAYRVDPDALVAQFHGNPQALMQAAMSGQIDPTAAVIAGMQIKAGQNQQAMQGGLPPTVAQDTFAPPQQPQAPQQAQAPQGATPPQGGMPPAGGLGATPPAMGAPQPPTPPQAPPMGMADGGMVPPYMQSGLDGIPVPDTMFDENRNGGFDDGYAGGGLVAFAGGGPTTFYGYDPNDPMANTAKYEALFGKPQTRYADEYEQELLQERTPEARKRAKKEDLAYAMMAMGSRMASTPGGFLQSLGAGFGEAAPILRQSAKERKAEDRELRKGLLDLEAGRNTAAAQKAAQLLSMQQMGISGMEAEAGRKAQIELEGVRQKGDINLERLKQSGRLSIASARGGGGGGGDGGGAAATKPRSPAQLTEAMKRARKDADAAYENARAADAAGDAADAERYLGQYSRAVASYNRYANAGGDSSITLGDRSKRAFPNLNKYVGTHGRFPSGRASAEMQRKRPNPGGPQVERGQIIKYDAQGNRI